MGGLEKGQHHWGEETKFPMTGNGGKAVGILKIVVFIYIDICTKQKQAGGRDGRPRGGNGDAEEAMGGAEALPGHGDAENRRPMSERRGGEGEVTL